MFRFNEPLSGIKLKKVKKKTKTYVQMPYTLLVTEISVVYKYLFVLTSSHSAAHAGRLESVRSHFEAQNA